MSADTPYPFYAVTIAVNTASVSISWKFATTDVTVLGSGNGFYDGRVLSIAHEQTMFGGARTRGPLDPSNAVVTLNNGDGALDDFLNYPLDGQLVEITYFSGDDPLNPAAQLMSFVFRGLVGSVTVGRETVVLDVLSFSTPVLLLSAVPTKYLGNNALPLGIEGTADDLKGQPKPRVIGAAYNVAPKFVNTSKLIYQVEGQDFLRNGWSLKAYDKRVALTQGADYADQTDMETNAPSAGEYRVDRWDGCFRLGAPPVGRITCDVVNPAVGYGIPTAPAVTNLEIHSVLAHMLAKASAASPYSAYSAYFFGHDLAAYPTVGIYIDSETTWLNAINDVAASSGIALPFRLDNSMFVFGAQLKVPGTYLPYVDGFFRPWVGTTLTIDEDMVLDIDRVPGGDADRGVPTWRVNVNYKRNYTVMQPADVGAITAADLAFVQQEWRTASAEDPTVKDLWFNSQELTVNTLLTVEADAQAEADRLLALLSVRRDVFRITIKDDFAFVLGQYGEAQLNVPPSQYVVLTHSRFGLSAGKDLIVLTSTPDQRKGTVTMLLWG